jgi:hypothetical protein
MRDSTHTTNNTHLSVFNILALTFFERFTAGLMDKKSGAYSGCMAWLVRESPRFLEPSHANTLINNASVPASSFLEAVEMSATLASS